MRRLVLAAAGALLALFALTAIAAAQAPTQGRLIVVDPHGNVGAASGVTLNTIQAPNTYRTTVYVPTGYRAPGGVGKIGNTVAKATVFATRSDGSRVTMTGAVTVADPARYTGVNNPFKNDFQNCATSTRHTAVWLVDVKQPLGAATATFPVFVDDTATVDTKDATWAAYRLQWCAAAAANLKLTITSVDLSLVKMFDNPQARGMYFWRAVYDPLASDGKTIAATQNVAVTAAVPVSPQVSAHSTRLSAATVRVHGSVLAGNQALAGVRVQVFVGRQHRIALNRPNATVRTKADGSYSVLLRIPRGTHWLRVKAATPYLDITPGGGCTPRPGMPKLAAKGCVDATLAPFVVVSKPVLKLA